MVSWLGPPAPGCSTTCPCECMLTRTLGWSHNLLLDWSRLTKPGWTRSWIPDWTRRRARTLVPGHSPGCLSGHTPTPTCGWNHLCLLGQTLAWTHDRTLSRTITGVIFQHLSTILVVVIHVVWPRLSAGVKIFSLTIQVYNLLQPSDLEKL